MACKSQGQKGVGALPNAPSKREHAGGYQRDGQGMMGLGSDYEAPSLGLRFHLCQHRCCGMGPPKEESPKAGVPIPAFKLRPRRAEASRGSLQRKRAPEGGNTGQRPHSGKEPGGGRRQRASGRDTREESTLGLDFIAGIMGSPGEF